MRKFLAVFLGLLLAAAAGAEGAALEERVLELGGSSMRMPVVTGTGDADLEERINARIREDLRMNEYLERMYGLAGGDRSITFRWDGGILGDVFSGALEAEGPVKTLRSTYVWTWSNVDLRSGEEIGFAELFADAEAAREKIGGLLEAAGAEMSPHLPAGSVTPLPEGFRLEATGLTLLYGAEQLATLSGRAGAVKIAWNEIREVTDWSEDGIPARIGAADAVTLTGESRDRIRETAESGQLPDIPVKIGDSVKEWTDAARLLYDPEEYAGGRMFALEGAAFRDVYLLSDAVDSGWEESLVRGIRMDRGCLWGLCIGETKAEAWRGVLGEPDSEAVFGAEEAEYWRTVPGTSDWYEFGEYRLQLHCGEDGILAGITLTR